jgi:Coenzyme PQQ synthesis protein D (PqqD)
MAPIRGFIPRRRGIGLVTEELEGETLLYVEETHRAFCLNAAAAQVWRSIDGERDVESIAASASLEAPLVQRTLREMGEAGLLDAAPADALPEVDLSRRRMVRAGLVAIPLILAITVPRAAEAASACTVGLPGGPACSPSTPCCSGLCNQQAGTCG